jgi:hypothetical protein
LYHSGLTKRCQSLFQLHAGGISFDSDVHIDTGYLFRSTKMQPPSLNHFDGI